MAMQLPLTPPPTPPRSTSGRQVQHWDPTAILGIFNPEYDNYFTCPCNTQKKTRCTYRASHENVQKAISLVTQLATSNPTDPQIEQDLRRIAALTLCKRYHRIQPTKHDEVVEKWTTNIRLAIQTGSSNYYQSARASIFINVYFHPQASAQTLTQEGAELSVENSGSVSFQQNQPTSENNINPHITLDETHLENNSLRNDVNQRDEEIAQLRRELEEERDTLATQHRQRQIRQEQDSRDHLGDEALRQRQHQEDLQAERERRASEERRCHELEEELEAERKAHAEREQEVEDRQRRIDDDLQHEREARQRLQSVVCQQNTQQQEQQEQLINQQECHRQEQQRLQESLERLQNTLQSFQEHASRQQKDLDRARGELARRFRDTGAESPPPETPPTSITRRLRRRIGQRLLE